MSKFKVSKEEGLLVYGRGSVDSYNPNKVEFNGHPVNYWIQVVAKGYSSIKAGIGKPAKKLSNKELYEYSRSIWEKVIDVEKLRKEVEEHGYLIRNPYSSENELDHAQILCDILNDSNPIEEIKVKKEKVMKRRKALKTITFDSIGNPMIQVKGKLYLNDTVNDKNLVSDGLIDINPESLFYTNFIKDKDFQILSLIDSDPSDRSDVLRRIYEKLDNINKAKTKDELLTLICNPKEDKPTVVIVPVKHIEEVLHNSVLEVNVLKVAGPLSSPRTLRPTIMSDEILRIRVIDALTTEEGHPYMDGNIVANVNLEVIRGNDLRVMDVFSCQIRSLYEGVVLKAKMVNEPVAYEKLCKELNINPMLQDAICTKDCIKNLGKVIKHGQLLEIPVKDLIGVKSKLKRWNSSVGKQCVVLDSNSYEGLRVLLEAHGQLKNADTLMSAVNGSAEDFIKMIKSDTLDDYEDMQSIFIKQLFGKTRNNRPDILHLTSNTVFARANSYYHRDVIKTKCDTDAYYIHNNEDLRQLELEHKKNNNGEIQFYCNVPFNKDNKDLVGKKITLGRYPFVGCSNLMSFIVAGFSENSDCIEISSCAMYAMFADNDGDTLIVERKLTSQGLISFPCYERKLVKKESTHKPQSVEIDLSSFKAPNFNSEVDYKSLVDYHMAQADIGAIMINSQAQTGLLDNASRQIVELFVKLNKRFTSSRSMAMGEIKQDCINALKHAGDIGSGKGDLVNRFSPMREGEFGYIPKDIILFDLVKETGVDFEAGVKIEAARQFANTYDKLRKLVPSDYNVNHPFGPLFEKLSKIQRPDNQLAFDDSRTLQAFFKTKNGSCTKEQASVIKELSVRILNHYQEKSAFATGRPSDERASIYSKLKRDIRAIVDNSIIENEEKLELITTRQKALFRYTLGIFLGKECFGVGNKTEGGCFNRSGGAFWYACNTHSLLFIAKQYQEFVSKQIGINTLELDFYKRNIIDMLEGKMPTDNTTHDTNDYPDNFDKGGETL